MPPCPHSALETLRPGSGRAESLPLDSRSESGMTEVGVYYSRPLRRSWNMVSARLVTSGREEWAVTSFWRGVMEM